jgi:hypothetical protein
MLGSNLSLSSGGERSWKLRIGLARERLFVLLFCRFEPARRCGIFFFCFCEGWNRSKAASGRCVGDAPLGECKAAERSSKGRLLRFAVSLRQPS